MMNVIIFSKDRACQLELFLRSMKEMWKECMDDQKVNISVLFTASKDRYWDGYYKLINKGSPVPLVLMQKQESFKIDVLSLVNPAFKHTVFFVDDMVWKEPFSLECEEFKEFESRDDVLCLSLRLHPKLPYCYVTDKEQKIPKIEDGVFDWTGANGDYGYPMSLDGHIFRTEDILPLLKIEKYANPNELEAWLSGYEFKFFKKRPCMVCCEKSPVMNVPLNQVHEGWVNRHGRFPAKYLNDNFLKGFVISMDEIRGFKNKSCHQEVDIKLEKA